MISNRAGLALLAFVALGASPAAAQQVDAISREFTIWVQDPAAQQTDAISRELTIWAQDPAVGQQDAISREFTLRLPMPDLAVSLVSTPPAGLTTQPMTVSWRDVNVGETATTVSFTDRVYYSTDPVWDASDQQLGSGFPFAASLTPGAFVDRSQTFTYPGTAGTYYIIVRTNADSTQVELDPANNTIVSGIFTVTPLNPPRPDLTVALTQAPTGTVLSSSTVTVAYQVTNLNGAAGTTAATNVQSWKERVYLTTVGSGDPSSGVLLGQFDNLSFLDVGQSYSRTVQVQLPADFSGTRYIAVVTDATGVMTERNETNNTAFSGTFTVGLEPQPDLVVDFSGQIPLLAQSGSLICPDPMMCETSLRWVERNQGSGVTNNGSWQDAVYLSVDSNPSISPLDQYLDSSSYSDGILAPGAFTERTATLLLPLHADGPHFVKVLVDSSNVVSEFGAGLESNNVGVKAIDIFQSFTPDLVPQSVGASGSGALAGHTLAFSWTVSDDTVFTDADVPLSWTDHVWLSADATVGDGDVLLFSSNQSAYAAQHAWSGTNYTKFATATLPQSLAAGSWRLIVQVDAADNVYETRTGHDAEANNMLASAPFSVNVLPTDLRISASAGSNPASAAAGASVPLTFTVQNVGPAATDASIWTDRVVLSSDAVYDASDPVVATVGHYSALGASPASYTVTTTGTIPFVAAGSYRLFFVTDSSNNVWELGGETNNTTSLPFDVLPEVPNLVPSLVNAPEAAGAGQTMVVGWRITNTGSLATQAPSWRDEVWLSADTTLGPGDVLLGSKTHGNTLAAGASYDETASFVVPTSVSGLYYVLLVADAGNNVFEGSESDNVANDRMQIAVTTSPPPNLVVDDVTAPTGRSPDPVFYSGQALDVAWTVRNAGTGSTQGSSWSDSVYLSQDQALDVGSDIYLGARDHAGFLAPGETYTTSWTFTVPVGISGQRFVLVRTNSNTAVPETSVLDDVRSCATTTTITLPPSADLHPTSLAFASTATSGQYLDVSWTTANESGSAVSGSWTDTLYLSTDNVLDGADVVLGQVVENVTSLAVGGTHPQSAHLLVPGVVPATYRVLLWSDTLGQVPETDESDNVIASSGLVACDMPSLVPASRPGNVLPIQLPAGTDVYARVVAPAGLAVRISLEHDSPTAWTELFASPGSVPSPGVAQFRFDRPGSSDQSIVVPETTGAPYFVLARATFGTTSSGATLRAEILPFEVTSVAPSVAGRGRVTLRLDGSQLGTLTGVALTLNGGSETHAATEFLVVSTTRVLASFDLQSASIGMYDVVASGSGSALLASAVTVEDARPFQARVTVKLAPSIKKGSSGVGGIEMRCTGNVDTPWTVLALGRRMDPKVHVASAGLADMESGPLGRTALWFVDDLGPSDLASAELQVKIDADSTSDELPIVLTGRALDDTEFAALVADTAEDLRQRVLADPGSGPSLLSRAASQSSWQAAVATAFPPDTSDVHDPAEAPLSGRGLVQRIATGAASGLADVVPATSIDAALGGLACTWLGPTGFDCATLSAAACSNGSPTAEIDQVSGGNEPSAIACTATPTSNDPNDKTHPAGWGTQHQVASGTDVTYRVYFENVAGAAAPAALVLIDDPLEAGLVASSFRPRRIKFGDHLIELPESIPTYSSVIDLSATLGVKLQVFTGVDGLTDRVFWRMQSLDPATNLPITDGARGFLPPNDGSGRGSGYVEFLVSSSSTVTTGTVVANRASVKFDLNPSLPTNSVQNALDGDDPSSHVSATMASDFVADLSWSGSDADGGSGLESYTVFVSVDGGPYAPLVTDSAETARTFHGDPGHTYSFYSRSRDHTGRRESAPPIPDVIVETPPDCNHNGIGDPSDISSGTSADCDSNEVPDECQSNADGDSAIDACDGCPSDPAKTAPGQCGCAHADTDTDGDGVADCHDDCPTIANADQADCDHDGVGDACSPQFDCNENGILDSCDIAAHTSADLDHDHVPDECQLGPVTLFCVPGSAGVMNCPCTGRPAAPRRGCESSASTGGGSLAASGKARTSADTLKLTASDLPPRVQVVFLQGNAALSSGFAFGDGVSCLGGAVTRLAIVTSAGGVASFPPAGATISQRSAQLGDAISAGKTRWYQALYRDPSSTWACGGAATFNLTHGLRVPWAF